jgi:hypothetical protein
MEDRPQPPVPSSILDPPSSILCVKTVVIHLLRYDDFSAVSDGAVEEKLIGLLLKHRVPCTFGVIPFVCAPESLLAAGDVKLTPLPGAKAGLLKPLLQAGLAEIALHGFAHLALAPVRGLQEFSDRMPLETQRQLIRRGKGLLESVFGTKVRLFVPPWNRLGRSTLVVLREEGLFLSGGELEAAQGGPEIGQLPCVTSIRETDRALATARRFGGQGWVGTVLHDYDFKESDLGAGDVTLAELDAAVSRWKGLADVEPRLISDAISATADGQGGRALANLILRETISARRLRRKFMSEVRTVYWDAATAGRLTRRIRFIP